ncbi:NAD(P)/FAD-dependent oxidoreductase [Halomonas binhaiensis]|uniref:NAD(P)/FAD-dependent oxidoreductase n=1 Tax=Halomonas binhaiensis TaxID=2562282 RepID=A0A5C1NJX7_9GAMM|nr:NAD(P)/FAD-dependent oxidoreductase [Halomonas binhaiensis]QEM82991.1 NAD(P)/FAD-dependent oxidoreductase [Halomonas binhaiensis]
MTIERQARDADVIVIGGSYAGQSAAMQLARARKRVVVMDAGLRRNRFAASSHGLVGQDGRSPDAIALDGRRQVEAYPNVEWWEDSALRARHGNQGFEVESASGRCFQAATLVIATGVVDELPAIEGLEQRWGKSVFHCPYCHGYELEQGRIGVIAVGPMSLHHAMMLPDWGDVTLFTNQALQPGPDEHQVLIDKGVTIEPQGIKRIVDTATVELQDGRQIALDGIFTVSRTRMASPIAEQLGCVMEEGPMGPYIVTDETKETSVPGVFACGDAARMAGSVSFALGDGAQAGISAHRKLIFA